MRRKYFYACILATLLTASCGKKMPKDVIPADQMESILYDYHLSSAMQSSMPHVDNVKREAMRRYVFSKHGVTEEQFDSSMVWYTRHSEELAKIYTNLKDRFAAESEHVSQLLSSREEGMTLSLPGDTVDMWHGDAYYRLEARNPLNHILTFSLAADSNFQANDAIRWTAHYDFMKDAKAVVRMGLSVIYDNDSVAGEVKNVTRSGSKSIYIPQDSAYSIRQINGFIYVPAEGPLGSDILVHDVELMRYHVPFDSTKLQKAVDTIPHNIPTNPAGDSILQRQKMREDSLRMNAPQKRLSPDELKRQPAMHPTSGAARAHHPATHPSGVNRPTTKLPANNRGGNRHVQ